MQQRQLRRVQLETMRRPFRRREFRRLMQELTELPLALPLPAPAPSPPPRMDRLDRLDRMVVLWDLLMLPPLSPLARTVARTVSAGMAVPVTVPARARARGTCGLVALQVEGEVGECAVCLERMEVGEWMIPLPCQANVNHCYHRDCITPWLENSRSCPQCRGSF